jgi:hypothetical protein
MDKRLFSPEEILDDFHRETKNLGLSSRSEYMQLRTKAVVQLAKVDKQGKPDREKIASMYWASMANFRRMDGRTDWQPVDMRKQGLVDFTPFLDFADQILALFDEEGIRKDERERIIKYLKIRFASWEGGLGKSRVTFSLSEDWETALRGGK